ncbi:MAG: DUF2723 domain-containing protein, partial [Chloroflexota bacterium]
MRKQIWQRWAVLGPAVALGLYSGRIVSEVARPTLPAAIVVTLFTCLAAVWLLRRRPLRQAWPAVLLLLYVFSWEPDPRRAVLALALAATTTLLNGNWQLVTGGRWQVAGGISDLSLAICHLPLAALIAPLLVAGFFSLYLLTLAPGVLPADSGELQLAAYKLGVAHPPGFPLYTLLAHLFTRLPFAASAAYKVNLWSAVTSALTVGLIYRSTLRLARRRLAGVVAAVALGTSTTFWSQATTANVRSLTALFAALCFYLLLGIGQRESLLTTNQENPRQSVPSALSASHRQRSLILLAAVLSLGLTHHPSLVFMAAVFGLYALLVDPALLKQPGRWPPLLLAGLAGLLPLLYLPWRGAAGAWGAPNDLTTLPGFLNHALALGFRGDLFYFREASALWQRFLVMGNVMAFQFSPLLLVGMVGGLLVLLWRERRPALLLGGSFAIHTLITATYRAPQTVEYMLPAYVPAALCLGYLVGWCQEWIERTSVQSAPQNPLTVFRSTARAVYVTLPTALLVVSIQQATYRYPSFATLHSQTHSLDYARGLLTDAPANTVILADWHWATPLWYSQEVEGQRPDVTIAFVFPTGEAYADTWARRIGEELAAGRPVIATHYDETAYLSLPSPEPVGEAFLFSPKPRQTLPDGYQPLALTLGQAIHVLGYALQTDEVEIGDETTLALAWRPSTHYPLPIALFAHLVGGDGQLYGQADAPIRAADPTAITLTQFRLTVYPGARPGPLSILIGAYTAGGQPLTDAAGQSRTAIASLTVTPMSRPPLTQHPTYRTLADGPTLQRLIGYDGDNTLAGRPRLYLHWQTEQGYYSEVVDGEAAVQATLPPWYGLWGQPILDFGFWILDRSNPKSKIQNPKSHYIPLGQGLVWV